MNTQKIGAFLAQLRREKHMTQEQLAEKLGVSNRSVSRWENGNTMPDLAQIPFLCAQLDISVAEFFHAERSPETCQWKTGVSRLLELAQQQQREKARRLNTCFGVGFFLLLLVGVLPRLPGGVLVVPGLYSSYGIGILLGLGMCMVGRGFCYVNQYVYFTEKQIAVMTEAEDSIAMETAEEMLQFARKYQKAGRKQHTLAFEAMEQNIHSGETVRVSFVWDGCTINANPEQWHGAAAVTDRRFLFTGETVRGRLMTAYPVQWYERQEIRSIRLINNKLVLKSETDTVIIRGENLAHIWETMKKQNMIP